MTTTVLIGTMGNKAVEIDIPGALKMVVQPGKWLTQTISGDQEIKIKETGEFINNPPQMVKYVNKEGV